MKNDRVETSEGIKAVCWSDVPVDLTSWWADHAGARIAIWPAPVDGDACFEAAGFTEFADTDERWDRDLRGITERLVGAMSELGSPRIRSADEPVWHPRNLAERMAALFRGLEHRPTLLDTIACSITNDNFAPCVVDFGEQPVATLCTSDGHSIWWVWLSASAAAQVPELLTRIAAGLPVVEQHVKVAVLVPRPRH